MQGGRWISMISIGNLIPIQTNSEGGPDCPIATIDPSIPQRERFRGAQQHWWGHSWHISILSAGREGVHKTLCAQNKTKNSFSKASKTPAQHIWI